MGWQLAEEVAWARPEKPGREWWTLMDIAQDARDETRQGIPGYDYLAARGKCSRATVYRRLRALTGADLITVARKAAPGRRAVYEITEKVAAAAAEHQAACLSDSETRLGPSGLNASETRSGVSADADESQRLRAQRVSKPEPTGLSVSDAVPVTKHTRHNRQHTSTALDLAEVEVTAGTLAERIERHMNRGTELNGTAP
jgi:DNA-binding MarR family transcriptional regulator